MPIIMHHGPDGVLIVPDDDELEVLTSPYYSRSPELQVLESLSSKAAAGQYAIENYLKVGSPPQETKTHRDTSGGIDR
jgi:hypothetical protein